MSAGPGAMFREMMLLTMNAAPTIMMAPPMPTPTSGVPAAMLTMLMRPRPTATTTREAAQPQAGFTAGVMTRVVRERSQTERAIDMGFNLAIAAGVLILISGAAGLAWASGLLTITLDIPAILSTVSEPLNRVVSNLQTLVMAAALLTMALGLWWWAEADPSL